MAGGISGDGNPLSQGSDPHSVETAAADFSAMLTVEDAPERPRREREKPAARSPEPEGADDTAERPESQPPKGERREPGEGQDDRRERAGRDPILDAAEPGDGEDDPDGEGDDLDDQDNPDDQDDDPDGEGDDFLDAKHKIQVNGQEVEISGRDALAGYMRQADYTAGTERNAREYEEIQSFADETVTHRQEAVAKLDEAVALIAALQPSDEDWATLKANNPQGYIAAQEHWNGLVAKARKAIEDRNALAGQSEIASTRKDAKYFKDQERQLHAKLPALTDPKKAEGFRNAVMEYGLANGYTEAELVEGATDHRDLITLYKAAMYDKSRKSIADAGRRAGGKAPKPAGDGRARVPGKGGRGNPGRAADRRLARTGSLGDAADAFADMIRREV